MDDDEFNELQLKMAIAPSQARWPTGYTHWEKLHAVPDEARRRVAQALEKMNEVKADPNLSPAGKKTVRADIAKQAVADFQKSNTLEHARAAVARQQKLWAAKLGEIVKPAEDIATATVYAQIRDRVRDMDKDRLAFLNEHAGDPVIASAILTAPAFLSGLSNTERAVVKRRIEKHFISPEIADAKAATEKALAEAEHGWSRAMELIAQSAGLEKAAVTASKVA